MAVTPWMRAGDHSTSRSFLAGTAPAQADKDSALAEHS
jgi:hypothetical protein